MEKFYQKLSSLMDTLDEEICALPGSTEHAFITDYDKFVDGEMTDEERAKFAKGLTDISAMREYAKACAKLIYDAILQQCDAVTNFEEETPLLEPDNDKHYEQAIAYVRNTIDIDDVGYISGRIWKNHGSLCSEDTIGLSDRIYDLMEEYGQDNDLPENWWLNEGDIEDVFDKLLDLV